LIIFNYFKKITKEKIQNLFNLLDDQNEEIRKFVIRNLRDISETNKKTLNTYFDPDLITNLINYLITKTKCKKEIYEITTILIKATYDIKKISEYILINHIELISYLDDFLENFNYSNNLECHLAVNHITIITNLLIDNNSKSLNLEKKFFECLNLGNIFKLFVNIQNLPNFIRTHIIWLFTNSLKIKKIDDIFHNKFYHEIEKFLSNENNLDILIKFFNYPTITKLTTEILNFLLPLLDLENETILIYLQKNLNFNNKHLDILTCFPDNKTLLLTFKLINKMMIKEENFDLKFFKVNETINKIGNVLQYIEKEILKYTPNIQSIDINATNFTENFKNITINQEMVNLLDYLFFSLLTFVEKKNSVVYKILENDELLNKLNDVIMLITKNGITKSIDNIIENYLNIIINILDIDDYMVSFFECIRCQVFDLLTDLIKKLCDEKNLIVLILQIFDKFLYFSENLIDENKNLIEIKLEKLGIDTIIDNMRSDNNDALAEIANSIFEIYFNYK